LTPLTRIFLGEKYKHIWHFLCIIVPNIVAALFEGISFGLVMLALSALNGENTSYLKYIPLSSQNLFIALILAAILFQAIRSGLNFFGQYRTLLLTLRIQEEVQARVYRQIMRLSFPCVSKYKVGDLVEYARAPSIAIPAVMDAVNKALTSSLMSIALISLMTFLSKPLTLATLTLLLLVAISQHFIIRKIVRGSKQLTHQLTDLSKHTVQSLHGIRALFTFGRQDDILHKTLHTLEKIIAATKKVTLWNHSILPINEIMGMVLVGTCLSMGAILLKTTGPSIVPILLTFVTVTYRLTNRLQSVMLGLSGIATHIGSMARINEIITDADKEFISTEGIHFQGLKEKIVFDRISLRYEGKERLAIQELSLTIPKGGMIAFVGASGAGKSSIIDVLLKLYKPVEGKIWIDDQELSTYNENSWRKKLGVVSQDTILFNESIEENIRFGDMEATGGQVKEAAVAAGVDEMIENLPQGYQTVVGERGYRLSGGERQRIALARALLRKPEILVLDEATSNLDSHSENLIQKALETLQRKTTIIVIAHRLSTVRNADQIFVIEKGRVIEEGSHVTLLQKGASYAHFWKSQLKE
jgi:ATP-binding cassette subfamily B protein/subfamily B ATP-binding cassette protein MsbA